MLHGEQFHIESGNADGAVVPSVFPFFELNALAEGIAYLEKTYGSVPKNTMAQQMEDYLFLAEESTGYVLGNALALVDPESMELEIQTFENSLRRVVAVARKKAGGDIPPS